MLVGDLDPPHRTADMQVVTEEDLRTGIEPLLAPFDRGRTELILGPGAGWAEVAASLERGGAVGVLHVLAHGSYDGERERGAFLALRTRVFSEDVEALGGCARLVVLSACSSARGPERFGSDNLAHLGGAFLRAGARCVILTRAEVLLGRTLRLDAALHESLATGESVAEALRRARVAAVDEDPFSPYLVGRFQAYGVGSIRPLGQ
jgi:CHAT domain-containing protein